MGSTRLPGKMLLPLFDGKGALQLMLERVRVATTLDRVVIATTDLDEDAPIAELCTRLGFDVFRGHPTDVLDRYYQCAMEHARDEVLVRLTGDCPLHDAAVIDRVVAFFRSGGYDYASNTHPPTYPDGLDTEVFTFDALREAWEKGTFRSDREHVTYYIYNHPQDFRLGNLENNRDLSSLRWTLDEPADLEFMRKVYGYLGPESALFSADRILVLLAQRPELLSINGDIERNAGLKKTLAIDHQLGNLK